MTAAKRYKQMNEKEVIDSFLACPRCGYFLSSYRLSHDDFKAAVADSTSGWLKFTWDHRTRLLINKSFGSSVNLELESFQGICPDCQRPYVYLGSDAVREDSGFRTKIVP